MGVPRKVGRFCENKYRACPWLVQAPVLSRQPLYHLPLRGLLLAFVSERRSKGGLRRTLLGPA